jgi:hypothetical protein
VVLLLCFLQNIQSTNWQSVRFKPPPPGSSIGWRVEFRTMEIQLTDFENAAFAVFIALVSRAILFFDLNLYIPISKVLTQFCIHVAHSFFGVCGTCRIFAWVSFGRIERGYFRLFGSN